MRFRRQNREAVRTVSLRLRKKLTAIDDATSDADDLLSELEEAAGLVRDDGSRIDEAKGGQARLRKGGRQP